MSSVLSNAGCLAGLFSPPFVRRLAQEEGQQALRDVVEAAQLESWVRAANTVGDFFNRVYRALETSYRCEYLYKNAIALHELLDRHSAQSVFLHSELQVGNAKADVVLVNGTTQAYEIKTELDSLTRLEGQLIEYQKAFDEVYVVTYETCAEALVESLALSVGILTFGASGCLTTVRRARANHRLLDPQVVFDILRRDEYTGILRQNGMGVPDVPNTRIYRACQELFVSLPGEAIHAGFVESLKKRGREAKPDGSSSVPQSLRFHALTGSYGEQQGSFISQPARVLLH